MSAFRTAECYWAGVCVGGKQWAHWRSVADRHWTPRWSPAAGLFSPGAQLSGRTTSPEAAGAHGAGPVLAAAESVNWHVRAWWPGGHVWRVRELQRPERPSESWSEPNYLQAPTASRLQTPTASCKANNPSHSSGRLPPPAGAGPAGQLRRSRVPPPNSLPRLGRPCPRAAPGQPFVYAVCADARGRSGRPPPVGPARRGAEERPPPRGPGAASPAKRGLGWANSENNSPRYRSVSARPPALASLRRRLHRASTQNNIYYYTVRYKALH